MVYSKRLNLVILVLIAFIFTYPSTLFATPIQSQIQARSNSLDSLSQQQKIQELRIQNKLLSEHNQNTINILQWSLTFAAVFLLGFLGLIGYFTQRRFQTDKENLENSIKNSFLKLETTIQDDLNEKLTHHKNQIDQKVDHLYENVDEVANKAVDKELDPLDKKMSSLSSEISSQKSSISNKISSLKMEVLEIKANVWKEKKVYSISARNWTIIAKIALETKDKYQLSRALDHIEGLLSKDIDLDSFDKSDLTALLNNLPSDFSVISKSIKEKL